MGQKAGATRAQKSNVNMVVTRSQNLERIIVVNMQDQAKTRQVNKKDIHFSSKYADEVTLLNSREQL